jgi:hypothetical protein
MDTMRSNLLLRIASTDGDTKVSANWIATTLAEIGRGVDAVGGRILTDRYSRQALDPQAKSHFLQEVGYRSLVAQVEFHLNPDPFAAADFCGMKLGRSSGGDGTIHITRSTYFSFTNNDRVLSLDRGDF